MLVDYRVSDKIIVETQIGRRLGYLCSLWINIDTHQIVKYVVRGKYFLGWSKKEFLISPEQVIKLDRNKMVVKETGEYTLEAVENESTDKRSTVVKPASSINSTRNNY